MPRKLRSLTVEEFDHVTSEMHRAADKVMDVSRIIAHAYGSDWAARFIKLHSAIVSLGGKVGDRQGLHAPPEAPKMYLWQGIRVIAARPYVPGECLTPHVFVSQASRNCGSPKDGDMICRNSLDDAGWWLVEHERFQEFAEEVT